MIHERSRKGKMTSWLLPVVLLLSLFTFSGINNPSATRYSKALTEQVDPLRVSKKRVASFHVFNLKSHLKFDRCAGDFQQISIFHARTANALIKRCAALDLMPVFLSQLVLHAPRSSAYDSFIS